MVYNDTAVSKNEALKINKPVNDELTPISGVTDLLNEDEKTE